MATVTKEVPDARAPEGIWSTVFSYHPFEPVLARAEGIYLYDEDGKQYIDASGGPIAVNLAHGDPRIAETVAKQMEKYSYCHPVLSNRPRAELCEKLAKVMPPHMNATYLVSGGSEAVETAMKIARQYHVMKGNTEKYKIVSNHDSYHGMTLSTLAVSGNPATHRYFEPMLQKWPKVHQYSPSRKPEGMDEKTWALACAAELEEVIHYAGPQSVAAYLATPVGAGSDYGVVAPPEYWQAVREICDRNDVLLIDDEVVTGFGRTGKWFAIEHHGIQADIMIMGKGISSLYAPLGAVALSDEINEPFTQGAHFVHGFTHGGHPVACAIGSTVLDIIEEDGLVENAAEVGDYLQANCARVTDHTTVREIRGAGLLRVGEIVKSKETLGFFDHDAHAEHKLQAIALKNGLAFYATLYGSRRGPALNRGLPLFIAPPLCITREQVDDLLDRLDQTLTEWEKELGVGQ